MNIGNCELLDAIGSSSPMYYIIGWNASQEEINSKIIFDPFSNDGNKYLHSTLSSLGVANSVRFNKVLKFNNIVWNPSENQLNLSRKQLNQDILETNPRVIVALGGKVAEFLLGNKFISLSSQAGKNLKCEIDGKEFSLVITYSPEFLTKDDNVELDDDSDVEDTQNVRNRQKFINDLLYAGKIANGEISDLSAKQLVTARTYEEFYDYYEKNIKDAVYVAYDIETNAQPVHFDTFRIIGFSLSADPMSGVYVIRESLDYVIPDSDWEKIVKLAVNIIDSHNIIVHNCMYEIPSTLNNWKYRIKEFDDTMVMSRLLLGGKTGAGLKEQCQINLGYPEWEEDLTLYRETMDHFRNMMKPTPAGKQRWYYTFMIEHNCSLFEMREELLRYNQEMTLKFTAERDAGDISQEDYEKKIYDKIVNSKESEVISKISSLEVLIRNYYPEDEEFHNMMKSIGKEMVNLVESNNFGFMPYSSVPSRLLSKYGAIDAVGTRELFDNLSDRFNKESTDDVNLWEGYRIMKAQFRVAVSMEMNGLYWDDSVAESEYKWFNAKAIESMRNLVNSGYLDDKMFWSCRECWIKYLIENNPEELKNLIGEDFYLTQKGIKKSSGGREILFRNVPNLISESYWNENREFFLNYIKKIEVYDDSKYKWYSDFKYIYNPASPKQEEFLTGIVITDDVRIANVLYLFTLVLEDKESGWERYSDNDRKPFELIKSIQDYNVETSKYNDSEEGQKNPRELISNSELFDRFKELISNQMFYSKELNQKLIDGLNYKLENAREGSILFLYKLYTIVGKDDIEKDRSTWTPGFRFLVDFRSYKKCIKMMTTYITGAKVGRGSVTEVSREDIDNNVELPLRHSYYSGNKPENSEYLMQSNFKVCFTGDTKVKCLDGNSYTFKELIDNDIKELWVYSKDSDGNVIPALAMNIRETARNQSLVRITLDSGDVITCTPNHEFMLRDGSYKEARFLSSEDSLMSCYFRDNDKGYIQYYDEVKSKWVNVHTMVNNFVHSEEKLALLNDPRYSELSKRQRVLVTHHKNLMLREKCKRDNTPDNLQWMYSIDHFDFHSKNAFKTYNGTERHRENARHCKLITEFNGSERQREIARRNALKNFTSEIRYKNGVESITKYNKSQKHRDRVKITSSRPEHIALFKENCEKWRKTDKFKEHCKYMAETFLNNEEGRQRASERMAELNKDPDLNKLRIRRKIGKYIRNLIDSNLDFNSKNYDSIIPRGVVKYNNILNYFDSYEDALEYGINYNHKILSIEFLDYKEDVYDLEVPEYHNFLLDCGVFVHNCATETFRWRSGHHTIPGDATIKNIYRSRYKGGVIFAPDYSQAEIRMIAGLSNCKTMIDAFINGLDIHRFNAGKIFQVPIEEVTSAQRRYAKMFSFSILYGSTPEGAANDYLNGDVALARTIFDDFYKAFPEIKDFIADMHDRMHKYGKVPVTKTGMFIKIDPSDFRGDIHKAERAAQNYPVQACSSNVAGYVLSKANDYILDNNMRSKTILFIHDSLEFDVYPYDMLDLADYLIHKMNDIPMQEFGVPMKIDLALGVSMGQEVEMSNLELSEDKRSCTCVIEGLEEDFDLLIENWKDVYSVVEWEDIEEPSDIYIPKGNLFLAKVAISHKLGKKQREIKRKVKIAY